LVNYNNIKYTFFLEASGAFHFCKLFLSTNKGNNRKMIKELKDWRGKE
jgi:hypothetical protein